MISENSENEEDALRPIPLWLILYIYCKAERECYIDYMQGLRALVAWEEREEGNSLANSYREARQRTIPPLFYSYQLQQVSKHTGISVDTLYSCMIEEVIPRLEFSSHKNREKKRLDAEWFKQRRIDSDRFK